ncbi:hypothetical protein [Halomonas sp. E14]|uniref:hypothetical protein n=2 Tax=unclassified Halomonas TaxID=2609666 RepID=UPI00403EC3EE
MSKEFLKKLGVLGVTVGLTASPFAMAQQGTQQDSRADNMPEAVQGAPGAEPTPGTDAAAGTGPGADPDRMEGGVAPGDAEMGTQQGQGAGVGADTGVGTGAGAGAGATQQQPGTAESMPEAVQGAPGAEPTPGTDAAPRMGPGADPTAMDNGVAPGFDGQDQQGQQGGFDQGTQQGGTDAFEDQGTQQGSAGGFDQGTQQGEAGFGQGTQTMPGNDGYDADMPQEFEEEEEEYPIEDHDKDRDKDKDRY